MKKVLIYFMMLLPMFMLSSCEEYEMGKPEASTVAEFTYTLSNNGEFPSIASFENKSINASSFVWNFGNGQTSTEANPKVTYEEPGFYTVTLTCTAENNVYYNKLVRTQTINIKDPTAGRVQVLYFSSRGPDGGGVHMVILDDLAPEVVNFDAVDLSKPYGLTVDTANSKVYVSDYSLGYIYRFDSDGKNAVRILDAAVPGQEIVDSPQGLMVVGDKLYWGREGGIHRCNLDGTSPELFIKTEDENPIDMQYDEATGKIYFVNDGTDFSGGYFSVNFDGSELTNHIPSIDGTAIEVNTETNKVYMTVYDVEGSAITDRGLYICNTDGSGLAKIGAFGSKASWGITIDHERSKLLWGFKNSNSAPDGKIMRSNLDGSGLEDWLTGVSPHGMYIGWVKF